MQTRSQTKQLHQFSINIPPSVAEMNGLERLLCASNMRKGLKEEVESKIKEELEINIDFDEASEAWKSNKVSKGNGTYAYACQTIKKNGCKCSQMVHKNTDFCKRHII